MESVEVNSDFWKDRPTLVTGATGLVGGWLVKHLLAARAQVVCLVRDWVPHCELASSGDLSNVNIVRGDVCDQSLIERVLGEYEIDTVIHLAAQTIVSIANRNPVSTFESNIKGTWSVLEACRRSSCVKQIVTASSDKAYGDAEALPYNEDTPLLGRYPYDMSKSCSDMIAQSYASTFALPVAITRCGNFYGGGDLNWNRIVPGTIRSLSNHEPPVIRSDGRYIRDYFYVEDGAKAYMCLAEALSHKPDLRGEAFNFSTEERASVLDIVDMIRTAMNSDIEPVVLNEASCEIKEQSLCAAKARKLLGWQAQDNLQSGMAKTIQWYKEFFSR